MLSARQKSSNYLEPLKENVLREYDGVAFDHALLESSSRYGFIEFLNEFVRCIHHAIELNVLNIEGNYIT